MVMIMIIIIINSKKYVLTYYNYLSKHNNLYNDFQNINKFQ
jgi:hypothetical protein